MKIILNQSELNLLKRCYDHEFLEYRDYEFPTLEDFQASSVGKSDQYYLKRNEGGTYNLAKELQKTGFLTYDEMSWHTTFILTEQGLAELQYNNLI